MIQLIWSLDAPTCVSSLISNSLDIPPTEAHVFPSSTQPSSSAENVLSGFMAANGNQTQYSSHLSERNSHKSLLTKFQFSCIHWLFMK